ncbi:DUF1990 family protein [Brevibacterium casei]|nr:DUF1990 family protein [Brevibacterium casei]
MNHLEHVRDIGPAELFPLASEAILTWPSGGRRRHRPPAASGATGNGRRPLAQSAVAGSAAAARGEDLVIPVGSCIVVDVIDTERQAGFVYRTRPGHLESGVQTFLVSIDDDDRLVVSITSRSPRDIPCSKRPLPVRCGAEDDGRPLRPPVSNACSRATGTERYQGSRWTSSVAWRLLRPPPIAIPLCSLPCDVASRSTKRLRLSHFPPDQSVLFPTDRAESDSSRPAGVGNRSVGRNVTRCGSQTGCLPEQRTGHRPRHYTECLTSPPTTVRNTRASRIASAWAKSASSDS